MPLTLITGGARSGKSDYGEQIAADLASQLDPNKTVLFVATAQAWDDEMRGRIAAHRAHRPPHWHTIESPTDIYNAVVTHTDQAHVILLDCMTLLVSNLLLALGDQLEMETADYAVQQEVDSLLNLITSSNAHWIIITNEVGLGIVPTNRLARLYRDALGRANQRLAREAESVIMMVSGIPLVIKPVN